LYSVPWFSISSAPPGPDPEEEAPAREQVEARHLLGGGDGVALDDQADAGAHLQALGRGGGRHQRHEGIEGVGVLLGERFAARERGATARRDVGVLGHEQRLEAALLGGAGELVGADRVVGGEHADTQMHGTLLFG
jgi:hypothetical protein